jgi:phosphoenolpyruvate synthase/pyruvate phosphate dikinase
MANNLTKTFQEISKCDVKIAGGKGASLGEMTQVGISVPNGFVILCNAFDRFIEETDLNVEIDAALDTVDTKKVHTVENTSEKIQSMIISTEMPNDIKEEILKNYKKLDSKFVAVRSSATSEDSASAAWAGQLESYLNTTEEILLENVKKCWASLFTPRAIFYRFEKNLNKDKISVAVVVQKMVDSEKAGIAFSVHPITQDKNQIIIEAGFGLGEAIVSGSITPDSYVVDKQGFKILDINVNEQTIALYKKAKGGNELKKLGEKGKKQVLSEKEIIDLSKLIVKIENHFGFPVDIEWAKEKNKFYITQSRPITTLSDITENNQSVFDYIKSQKWFLGVRADESLLFYSAKRNGYVKYIKKEYGIEFAETIFIPLKKNYPIRVINLWQAKKFHTISNEKILKDPQILVSYIKENEFLYKNIETYGKKLISTIKKDVSHESIMLFNKILGFYEIASAQFIIIFSLGLKLAENKNNLKNIKGVIKKHDIWRNSVAFKEEAMGENIFYFLKFFTKRKKLKLAPLLLMKFLTINEVEAWLSKKLTGAEIKNIIKSRKDNGFIYNNLRNEKQEVIDDLTEITKIQKHFLKLDHESKKSKNNNEIAGQVAHNSNETLKGKIIVIKDKSELKSKNHLIDGKILVAIQTTPHYIPYMKKAKAIITDEGGLTCHAAIVAREFKIPCIVGTKYATEILNDNDLIEVDTDNGIIKILKKEKK